MLTQKQLVSLVFVLLLMPFGICEGREMKRTSQPAEQDVIPIIKYLEYGFSVLDITRGTEGMIDVEFSFTFNSRHMFHGMDILDDHGVFIPAVTMIFGDSGFSGKVMDAYPLSSGFERSVERNYAAFYTGAFLEEKPLATHYTVNYWYYGKQKISGRENDSQEIGATFFWPNLLSVAYGQLTPSYYLGYIWPTKGDSNVRECEGLIHVFSLSYDFEVSDFWAEGKSQAFRAYGDITYNDGYAGVAIKHDWSHATFGISTNLTAGNWTFTPSVNYQLSMEDSVNVDNDELWCGITMTYKF